MEVVRMIKVHMRVEGAEEKDILEEFEEIARKYGRRIKMEEIRSMLKDRF